MASSLPRRSFSHHPPRSHVMDFRPSRAVITWLRTTSCLEQKSLANTPSPNSLRMSTPPHSNSTLDAFEHFPARPGQTLKQGRYEVQSNLGAGASSTTWLVADTQEKYASLVYLMDCVDDMRLIYRSDDRMLARYRAAKLITVSRTREHASGRNLELEALQKIRESGYLGSLPILGEHFIENGPEGEHLCLIMNVLSTDVASLCRSAPKNALPVHVVQNIVLQTLEALVQLHKLNIIHYSSSPVILQ
jgi:serine/threonine-protein kinase SRPK3